MNKLIYDKDGEYVIKFKKDSEYSVIFKALECCSEYSKDIPTFINYDLGNGYENEYHNIEDFDKYYSEDINLLTGFLKWDGCMEIHDFNHHFCGYSNFMDRIIKDIYLHGSTMIGENFDKDLANFELIKEYE